MGLERPGEGFRGELAALVAVENPGGAVGPDRLLQAVNAEPAVQRVRDPPGQHLARIPIDHRHQVGEPVGKAHVSDIRAPNLVRMVDFQPAQQIGINLVPGMRPAGVRPRRHAREPQLPHQPLDPLAVDPVAQAAQVGRHLAAAVERMPRVFRVDQRQQFQFLPVRFRRAAGRVEERAGDARQCALAARR